MSGITVDDWRALMTALILLANALAGYLVFRSHDGHEKK
jgi:hypothetical protein